MLKTNNWEIITDKSGKTIDKTLALENMEHPVEIHLQSKENLIEVIFTYEEKEYRTITQRASKLSVSYQKALQEFLLPIEEGTLEMACPIDDEVQFVEVDDPLNETLYLNGDEFAIAISDGQLFFKVTKKE